MQLHTSVSTRVPIPIDPPPTKAARSVRYNRAMRQRRIALTVNAAPFAVQSGRIARQNAIHQSTRCPAGPGIHSTATPKAGSVSEECGN